MMMVVRGLAIGAIISAPMGPVGILCVQRTLDGGRRHGFYTGVGAAASDLFYCLLTGFGLSFIEGFLQANQQIIQLLGSIVLIGFGIYIMRKNPAGTLSRPPSTPGRHGKDMLSGFLFTFSNPLILFLIIGLFARFNFQSPEYRWFDYVIGYLSIVAGAVGWWWLITFAVNKVRAHFNLRSMWIVNRIIGIIIMIFAVFGIVTAFTNESKAAVRPAERLLNNQIWNPAPEPVPAKICAPGPEAGRFSFIRSLPSDHRLCGIDFTLTNLHGSPSRSYRYSDKSGSIRKVRRPAVSLVWTDSTGSIGELKMSSAESASYQGEENGGQTDLRFSGNLIPAVTPRPIPAILDGTAFSLDITDRQLEIAIDSNNIFVVPLNSAIISIDVMVEPGGEAMVEEAQIWTERLPVINPLIRDLDWNTPYNISESFLSLTKGRKMNPVCGVWKLYQTKEDSALMKRGGEYRVVIIPAGKDADSFDIFMLDGAVTLGDMWTVGRLKGRLLPNGYEDDWRVEWLDAEGHPCGNAVRAHLKDGLLEIIFPRHSTGLTFLRL